VLTYRTDAPLAWAMLDQPEKLNAMTRQFWQELESTVERANADHDVRVLILHGAGSNFSVGGDIEGLAKLRDLGDRRAHAQQAMTRSRSGTTGRPCEPDHAARGAPLGGRDSLARRMAQRAPLALAAGKQILNARFPEGWARAVDGVSYR
jgi:hypothetical protein